MIIVSIILNSFTGALHRDAKKRKNQSAFLFRVCLTAVIYFPTIILRLGFSHPNINPIPRLSVEFLIKLTSIFNSTFLTIYTIISIPHFALYFELIQWRECALNRLCLIGVGRSKIPLSIWFTLSFQNFTLNPVRLK